MKFYHATRGPYDLGITVTPTFYYASLMSIKDQPQYSKEMIFEEVRKGFYNDRPSRLACNYVVREYSEMVEYRLKHPHLHGGYIYEVTPVDSEKAVIFDADMAWLDCNDLGINEIMQWAHEYWSGTPSGLPRWETLCGGEGIIIIKELAGPIK